VGPLDGYNHRIIVAIAVRVLYGEPSG
jgi:hypothetical protein